MPTITKEKLKEQEKEISSMKKEVENLHMKLEQNWDKDKEQKLIVFRNQCEKIEEREKELV